MNNSDLIKEIRLKWGELYQEVRNNKITTVFYSKTRRVYESMINELERLEKKDIKK